MVLQKHFVGFMAAVLFLGGSCLYAANEGVTSLKREAITAVHTAAVGLGALLKDVSEKEAQLKIIRQFIDPIRLFEDMSGYFYVYSFDCVNVAHATQKELVGKNLFEHKDSHGKLDIQALSETAKKGGGFVEYFWSKPGSEGEFKKLGYVEPIPGTDLFIGTGIYLP
ncbi:MAG: cache domain-containing protein [Candidatus Riflebacteria bacterium]|nr:cache domain-containing protein [Candidatus Riflebacteria bacterium]